MSERFRCCEYHDRLPEEFGPGVFPDAFADGCECGLAGMGKPTVCCHNCPEAIYFETKRGISPYNMLFAVEECAS